MKQRTLLKPLDCGQNSKDRWMISTSRQSIYLDILGVFTINPTKPGYVVPESTSGNIGGRVS